MASSNLNFPEADPAELAAKFERNMHLLPYAGGDPQTLPETTWPALDAAAALDRARGCLIGLAVGEAFGSAVEYLPRGGFPELTGMIGGGPLGLAPGEWTDGTSMALCLGASLLAEETVEQEDFIMRLSAWLTQGADTVGGRCVAVGATTRAAIESYLADEDPAAGSVDAASAGNGSLIRLAPLAIFWSREPDLARFFANKQSRTTHGTIECLDACELFTAQLVDALTGADKTTVLRPRIMKLTPNTLAIDGGEWKSKKREQIRSSAYVIHTLEAALWAVWNGTDFHSTLILAANLGEDAAGVAAVAGQLAGALYGASGIPEEWRQAIAWREKFEDLAEALNSNALNEEH